MPNRNIDVNSGIHSLYLRFTSDRLIQKLHGWLRPELALAQLWQTFVVGSETRATLVCAVLLGGQAANGAGDMHALVAAHGGRVDRSSPCALLAWFADPMEALQVALHLQASTSARYGIALWTGACTPAGFTVHGRDWEVLVGGDVTRIEMLASQVAPGTINVSPESFLLLETRLADGVGNALLMAEYCDEVMTEASITRAPQPFAESSTFAGLGLT